MSSATPATKPLTMKDGHPPIVEQVKERAVEFSHHAVGAASSGAWLWPVRGILFGLSHPKILIAVKGALLQCLMLSVVVFVVVAFFLYLPQLAILVIFTGPLAPIAAGIAVLAESVLVLSLFARQLFLGPALTEVFDATLRARGQAELVKNGRKQLGQGGKDVGKALVRPLQGVSFDGIVRYLVTLPLNFVPVVGTVFFVLYNGSKSGPGWHARYFQLKALSKQQKAAQIEKRAPAYTAFGAMTLVLNLVPVVGLLFSFTNTIGAALWAAEIEAHANVVDAPRGAESKKTM